MAVFEGEKSSTDNVNNDTICDDEEVASYVPPRYLFYPSESGAATSLSHDPNDDIAAAIAAVAAGESDLKMPSAAVEVQQVGRDVQSL